MRDYFQGVYKVLYYSGLPIHRPLVTRLGSPSSRGLISSLKKYCWKYCRLSNCTHYILTGSRIRIVPTSSTIAVMLEFKNFHSVPNFKLNSHIQITLFTLKTSFLIWQLSITNDRTTPWDLIFT